MPAFSSSAFTSSNGLNLCVLSFSISRAQWKLIAPGMWPLRSQTSSSPWYSLIGRASTSTLPGLPLLLHVVDVRRDAGVPLLRQGALRIAEVILRRLEALLFPLGQAAIDDPDVLDAELLQHIDDHAGAEDFVVRQLVAGGVDEVQCGPCPRRRG